MRAKSILKVLLFSCSVFRVCGAQAEVGRDLVWIPQSADERMMAEATARLVIDDGKTVNPFCSGVSTGADEILTAGHCKIDRTEEALSKGQLFVEFYDPGNASHVTRIQVAKIDSEYSEERDIARFKLTRNSPLKFSIPLAYAGCDKGAAMISAGFGIHDQTSPDMGSRPKISEYSQPQPVVKKAGLVAWLQSWFTKSSNTDVIKLRSENGQACWGDSGGPVFCKSLGKLALAGVNNAINHYSDKTAGSFSVVNKARVCAKMTELQITPIQRELQIIEGWRNAEKDQGRDPTD